MASHFHQLRLHNHTSLSRCLKEEFISEEMESRKGFWSSLWSLICFLPFFLGLLLLGIIKGILLCPLVCIIVITGNFAVILGLWPAHVVWTYYCIARTKQLGPILKVACCFSVSFLLVLWPLFATVGSILIAVGYGFFTPLIATFEAIGEGKTDELSHCIIDGTWSTFKGSLTIVRDFTDVCYHSFFSVLNDLRLSEPWDGKCHEIRLHYLLGAFFVGVVGIIIDIPIISLIAVYKSPYMLFKGWHRLAHDLIGREGPFLETACVPFAGLAILLWPSAVAGAVVASILSSVFLGGYAAVVAYQESSIHMGLCYIISSLSIYDEYSNDILDMPEWSCFPRLQFRKDVAPHSASISRPTSFRRDKQDGKAAPSRSVSLKNTIRELKPLKLLERLFTECKYHGENLIAEGVITRKDIDDCKSRKDGSRIISIGLPTYCILQALLRSAKASSDGLLLIDNTEITTENRPKEKFFDWFFDPLMIIKEQIKANNLSEDEEDYLCKLVLFTGNPERLNNLNAGSSPQNERRRAEIDALARRLQGITKSISRYPTSKRRFEILINSLSEELAKKMGGSQSANGSSSNSRSMNGLARLFSQRSFGSRTNAQGTEQEAQLIGEQISLAV